MTTLLTTTFPSKDYDGVVPTRPVVLHLARRLLAVGEPVRILTNVPEMSDWPKDAEIFEGNPAEPSLRPQAFAGIKRLFIADADPLTVRELLTLAVAGGLQRAVTLSSHGPEIEIEFEPESWHWLAIEVLVERTAPEWVHIRPSPLMCDVLFAGQDHPERSLIEMIRGGETIRQVDLDAPYPYLHEDDLAEIAIGALFEPEFDGKVLSVTAPGLSVRAKADTLAAALGRTANLKEMSPQEAHELWLKWGWVDASEDLQGESDFSWAEEISPHERTVESLLGRPARSFTQWVNEHAEALK